MLETSHCLPWEHRCSSHNHSTGTTGLDSVTVFGNWKVFYEIQISLCPPDITRFFQIYIFFSLFLCVCVDTQTHQHPHSCPDVFPNSHCIIMFFRLNYTYSLVRGSGTLGRVNIYIIYLLAVQLHKENITKVGKVPMYTPDFNFWPSSWI